MFLNYLNRYGTISARSTVKSLQCVQNKCLDPTLFKCFQKHSVKTMQVCSVHGCRKKVCPPKPCDCDFRPPETPPNEKVFNTLMTVIKLIIFLAIVDVTWDFGVWSTSDVTQKIYCDLKYKLKDVLSLPNDEKTEENENKPDKKKRTLRGLWNLGTIRLFSLLGLHNHDHEPPKEESNKESDQETKPSK